MAALVVIKMAQGLNSTPAMRKVERITVRERGHRRPKVESCRSKHTSGEVPVEIGLCDEKIVKTYSVKIVQLGGEGLASCYKPSDQISDER
jgi:hypothetical protein